MADLAPALDPLADVIILQGIAVTGFAEGTSVTVAKDGNNINSHGGVDGRTTLIKNPDRRGTLTLRLAESSTFNQILQAHVFVAKQQGVPPQFPVIIHRFNGNVKIETFGWIVNQGNADLGTEVAEIEWTIGLHLADYQPIEGLGAAQTLQGFI